jgi:hypothetical protein
MDVPEIEVEKGGSWHSTAGGRADNRLSSSSTVSLMGG